MRTIYILPVVLLIISTCAGVNIKENKNQVKQVKGKIVFAKTVSKFEKKRSNSPWGSYRQLYVIINPNENNYSALPNTFFGEDIVGNPKWSPDGERIIFSVSPKEKTFSSIYIISKKGSSCKKIYNGKCKDLSFSPNGKRIVFVEEDKIWSMKIDGSDIKQLVSDIRIGKNIIKNISYPSLSPNNKMILFVGSYKDYSGNIEWGIFIIELDIYKTKQVISSKIVRLNEWSPCWSPDGRKIAFSSFDGIYIINLDGTNLKKITPPKGGLGTYRNPCWSSDGKKIMYNYRYSTDWPFMLWQNREELHIINIDGTDDKMVIKFKDVNLSIGSDFDWWTPKKDE